MNDERLLRECIQHILKEDDGGYGYMGFGDPSGGSPHGASFASSEQMYNIFIKPFANAIGVAIGKTKELSVKAQTLLKVAAGIVKSSINIFGIEDYKEIFEQDRMQIEKIKSEYAPYYQATWDAFNEADVKIAAFMFRPDLFLTTKFISKAPKVAANVLSVLTGGALDSRLSSLMKGSGRSRRGSPEGPGLPESVVLEQGEKETDSRVESLVKLAKHPKVRQAIASNPRTQQMMKDAKTAIESTLNSALERAKTLESLNTLEDLQKALGSKVPGVNELAKLPADKKNEAIKSLIDSIKKGARAEYAKALKVRAEEAVKQGVPSDHPYVAAFLAAAEKVSQGPK